MKRKTYVKPTTVVVKLQQQCKLLAGSERSAKGQGFTWDNDEG